MSAGYELTKASHDVTILEARTRPGGRVQTLRDPFAEGLYAEAGATPIPDHHRFTLDYAKLFGWARGATAYYKPGQFSSVLPHVAPPEGRIHFAGEHTSVWIDGWMQGALESGNRVAREVNAASVSEAR